MSVDHVAENGNRRHTADHHSVTEQRPAHVGDQDMRNDTHPGNDCDVHLRMSEEPEQVLPKQSRSTRVRLELVIDDQIRRDEEAGTGHLIQNHEDTGGH
jgi:hypothetical protein